MEYESISKFLDKGSKEGEWITGLIDIRLELHGRKEKEGEGEKGEKVNELSLSNFSRFSLDKILLDSEGGSKLSEGSDKRSQIFECWLPCAVYCEDKTTPKTSTQNSDVNSELVDPSSGIQGTGSGTSDSGSGTGVDAVTETERVTASKGETRGGTGVDAGTVTGAAGGRRYSGEAGPWQSAGVERGAGVGASSGDSQDSSDGLQQEQRQGLEQGQGGGQGQAEGQRQGQGEGGGQGQGEGQGRGGYYLNTSYSFGKEDSKVNDGIETITEKEKEREREMEEEKLMEEEKDRNNGDEVIMNVPNKKYRSNSTTNGLKLDGVPDRFELSRSFSEASMRYPDLLSPLKYARSVVLDDEKNDGEKRREMEEEGKEGMREDDERKEGGSERRGGEEKDGEWGGEKGSEKECERERGGGMVKEERHEDKEKRRRATHHHHKNPLTALESNAHTAITSPRRWSLDSIYLLNQSSSTSYSLPPMSQRSQGNDMMTRQINEISKFKMLENERNERSGRNERNERNEKGEKLRKNSRGEIIVRYEKYENNGEYERKGSRRDLSITAHRKEKEREREIEKEKDEGKEREKEEEKEREKRMGKEREKERERSKEKDKERDKERDRRNDKSSEKINPEDNQKRRRSLLATFSSAAMLSSPSHSQSYLASQSHTQSQSILDSDTHPHNDSFNNTRKARPLSSDSFSGSFFSRMSRVFNLTTSSPSPTQNQLSHTFSRFTTKNNESIVYEKRSPKSRLRVLLIEDSLAAQKLLGSWLRANGCDVMGALNGKLGLKCMKVKQFDICFVDFVTVRTFVFLYILFTTLHTVLLRLVIVFLLYFSTSTSFAHYHI